MTIIHFADLSPSDTKLLHIRNKLPAHLILLRWSIKKYHKIKHLNLFDEIMKVEFYKMLIIFTFMRHTQCFLIYINKYEMSKIHNENCVHQRTHPFTLKLYRAYQISKIRSSITKTFYILHKTWINDAY